MIKKVRGHIFDALAIVCGVLAYLQTADITSVLPPKYAWVPIVIGAANIGLHGVLAVASGRQPHDGA